MICLHTACTHSYAMLHARCASPACTRFVHLYTDAAAYRRLGPNSCYVSAITRVKQLCFYLCLCQVYCCAAGQPAGADRRRLSRSAPLSCPGAWPRAPPLNASAAADAYRASKTPGSIGTSNPHRPSTDYRLMKRCLVFKPCGFRHKIDNWKRIESLVE